MINIIMDTNSVLVEKDTQYGLFKEATLRSVFLLLFAGISDGNVQYIPQTTYTSLTMNML